VSSALNQNSNGIAAAGMTGPVYVTEPPLSPPSPRASAQAPMPTPPQPERPALEVAPAPAPAAAQPTGQRVKVFVRLTSGERVDAGSFGSLDQAKERGAEIARTLAADAPEWPFVAGRFLRPDTIVSLDVEPELSV
jgi:hypothetical protein